MSSASLLPNGYFNKLDVNRLSVQQLKVGKKVPPDPSSKPSWLFSLDISEASYDANEYTLTFKKSNVNIIRFSDRPFRVAKTESVNDLEELFSENTENSFKEDPPNGVLVMKQGQSAFEILGMSVKEGIVRYELRSLSNENLVSESGKMSFFIDNATSSSTVGLTSTPLTGSNTYSTYQNLGGQNGQYSVSNSKVTIKNTASNNYISFTQYTFTNCDFYFTGNQSVGFYTCTLQNCQFKGQNLTSVEFGTAGNSSMLTNTLIENCNLSYASINATLQNTTISYCDVTGAIINDSNISYGITWTGAKQNSFNNLFVNINVPGYNANISSSIKLISYTIGGWNFTTADLNKDLSKSKDLQNAYFAFADFKNATLKNANLTNAVLCGANLSSANLSGAKLKGANLTNAIITGANLSNATITWAQIQETANWKKNKDLSGINFTGFDFTDANLTNAIITGANLSNATITWAQIQETANWNGLGKKGDTDYIAKRDLSGITFPSKFDFSKVNLTGVKFINANLTWVNFTGATLTYADFTKATLTGAIFTDANLSYTTLTDANFSYSTIIGTNFTGAIDKSSANFTGAITGFGSALEDLLDVFLNK